MIYKIPLILANEELDNLLTLIYEGNVVKISIIKIDKIFI